MAQLHVSTGGGLGNRLLSVISGIRLFDAGKFDSFSFSWRPSPECNCGWDALFAPSPYLTNTDISGIVYPPGHTSLGICVAPDHNAHIQTHGIILPPDEHDKWGSRLENWALPAALRRQLHESSKQLVPVNRVRRALSSLDLHPKTRDGLHIRRTDILLAKLGNHAQDRYCEMNAALLAWLEGELSDRTRTFFVAAEDGELERIISDRFGGQIRVFPKTALPHLANGNVYRSETATTEALVDLLALSKTARIYADTWSSFSIVAQIFGNVPAIHRLNGLGNATDPPRPTSPC